MRARRKGKRITRSLTIRNVGSGALSGPMNPILGNLTTGARLVTSSVGTQTLSPPGRPHLTLDLGDQGGQLDSGASLTVNLVFTSRRKNVSFAPALFSGIAQP